VFGSLEAVGENGVDCGRVRRFQLAVGGHAHGRVLQRATVHVPNMQHKIGTFSACLKMFWAQPRIGHLMEHDFPSSCLKYSFFGHQNYNWSSVIDALRHNQINLD
jgi:hypothetical protein